MEVTDRIERNQDIAKMYLEGTPAQALARSYSLSLAAVRKILAAAGVKASDRVVTIDAKESRNKPLSSDHKRLGEQLYYHRWMVLKQERPEAAAKMGWTVQKIASIEKGVYDPTLSDLLDIQGYLKINIGVILNAKATPNSQSATAADTRNS